MAGSGSENRHRSVTLKFRATEQEAALIREQAGRAGVSVAAALRYAALNMQPLRASRNPSLDRQEICRLTGALGALAQALREAQITGVSPLAIEAMQDDLAELRAATLEALGRRS